MTRLLTHADAILRGRPPFHSTAERSAAAAPIVSLALVILCFGPVYGAVMGSYALETPERLLQVFYSAVKVPLLLAVSTLVCLPAFFVLSATLGLFADIRASLTAILAGQAVMSITLASLSPFVLVCYASFESYDAAKFVNGGLFAVSLLGAQVVARRLYRPLIAANPLHRVMIAIWGGLYVFVAVQMSWTLRPFIGVRGMETSFFRAEPFTNAYVEMAALIARQFQ